MNLKSIFNEKNGIKLNQKIQNEKYLKFNLKSENFNLTKANFSNLNAGTDSNRIEN